MYTITELLERNVETTVETTVETIQCDDRLNNLKRKQPNELQQTAVLISNS